MMARMGTRVTIVCRSRLLPRTEPEVSEALTEVLRADSVTVLGSATYHAARRDGDRAVLIVTVIHYSFPGVYPMLIEFPTEHGIRLTGIKWVEEFFAFCVSNGEAFFDAITYGIRSVLDALELIFVETPWMVIASLSFAS